MSTIRVLVGTRKGAFLLTSDGKRQKWDVAGPLFAGWEIYHVKGSPADPDRIYASQTSGWFGQIIQRSDDGGKTWHMPGTSPDEPMTTPEGFPKGESNKFVYDTSAETGQPLTTHQHYDGTQKPWEFKRVWHLEPSLDDPNTVYAGVEDAALFRSTDGGKTWHELAGLRAALAVPEHLQVLVVTKDAIQQSNSSWAQGGIASVLSPEDRFENHIEDTLTAGAGLCDRDIVELVVREAPDQIADLIKVAHRSHARCVAKHAGQLVTDALVRNMPDTGSACTQRLVRGLVVLET